MRIPTLFLALVLSFLPPLCFAGLTLPFLISDGMVVQRFEPIPVWGWSAPKQTLQLEFAGETKIVKSDSKGAWRTHFSPRTAGGPYSLSIQYQDSTTYVHDILVGDVWVCSGQSNMEWLLRDVNNAESELALATDTNIRHFKVPQSWSVTAESTLAGGHWQLSSPDTAEDFTAVGYFFAQSLRKSIDVPIGLLHSSWGGSNIESWMTGSLLGLTDGAAAETIKRIVLSEQKVQKKSQKKLSQWPNALMKMESDDVGVHATADWSADNLIENDWIELEAPMLWEDSGFAGLDGVAWYRKDFVLTKEESQQNLFLNLARIDDEDITWVNGVRVGSVSVYKDERRYSVAKQLLREGRNVIAIRVLDTGGGGGIYSDSPLSIEQQGKQRSLAGTWKFKVDKGFVGSVSNKNHTPTALYNKMIHPLFNIPVKGVLWYQGESNANSSEQAVEYSEQFKKLITYWRKQWGKAELPFYWVQLANYNSHLDVADQSPWALLRESQSKALVLVNTGQAITIDVGNPNDIHPRDKQTVGKRLALVALNKAYGKKQITYRGPVLKQFAVDKHKIIIEMNSSGPLVVKGGGTQPGGFRIAGADKVFHPAKTEIKGSKVIVWSGEVSLPVSVRYAWADNPESANLGDKNGLPAEPFRIDTW